MHKHLSRMLFYRDIAQDSILHELAGIIKHFDAGASGHDELTGKIYAQAGRLVDFAESYGFTGNIWHHYLAYLLAGNENVFSLACERNSPSRSSMINMVRNDFYLWRELFDYDFSRLEQILEISCFSELADYSPSYASRAPDREAAGKIGELCGRLAGAESLDIFINALTGFYFEYGVGILALNRAFRADTSGVCPVLVPVANISAVSLDDLIGYEPQKKRLLDNTKAFLSGGKANNLLLHGDSGTGKSTSVKAVLNMFAGQGLRAVEIFKHQFEYLGQITGLLKNRNYKFILYMDDLSFEEFETSFKYLKAIIEGGLEATPDNVLIYATSNRRHLIRETWSDRSDAGSTDDIHHSDTAEEKLSLVHRFGVTIYFPRPNEQEYLEIVKGIAAAYPALQIPEDILLDEARKWGLWHGNISGRRARQFINHLLGQKDL